MPTSQELKQQLAEKRAQRLREQEAIEGGLLGRSGARGGVEKFDGRREGESRRGRKRRIVGAEVAEGGEVGEEDDEGANQVVCFSCNVGN
jgi:hypothetical protein